MSKKTLFLFTLATFFLFTFSGGAMGVTVPALTPGIYTMSDDEISDGWWSLTGEIFTANGSSATDYWTITAEITDGPDSCAYVVDAVTYNYSTEYNIFFELFRNPNAWGDTIQIFDATGVMYTISESENDLTNFYFTIAGIFNEVPVTVEIWFNGTTDGQGTYPYLVGPSGIDFEEIQLTVAPIPGAAWLLGTGLIGLVVLKRRRQSGPV